MNRLERHKMLELKKRLHRTWARSDANADEFIHALTLLLIEQIVLSGIGKPAEECIRMAEAVAREIINGVNE